MVAEGFPAQNLPARDITFQERLTIDAETDYASFGRYFSVDGRWMATASSDPSRETMIYRRSPLGEWKLSSVLPRLPGDGDRSTALVEIDGDSLVLLRDQYIGSELRLNAIFYERANGVWRFVNKRRLSTATGGFLAYSLAIEGSYAAVGFSTAYNSEGRVWVFEKGLGAAGEWDLVQVLQDPASDRRSFGAAVDLAGNRLYVGAPRTGGLQGRVLEFVRQDDGEWEFIQTIRGQSNPDVRSQGWRVVTDGDYLAFRAGELSDSGERVFLFARDEAGGWNQIETIAPPNPEPTGGFGFGMDLSNGQLAIGFGAQRAGAQQRVGAIYLYEKDHPAPGRWGLLKKISAPVKTANQYFGAGVALADGQILARESKLGGQNTQGAIAVLRDPLIFQDGFEGGDRAWTRRIRPSLVSPGLEGTPTGLELTISPDAARSFVRTDKPDRERQARVGFVIDPQRVELGGGEVEILRLKGGGRAHSFLTLAQDGGEYEVVLYSADAGADYERVGSGRVAGNSGTFVQVDWAAASEPTASDGTVRLYTNGIARAEDSTRRNAKFRVNNISLGMPSGFVGTGSGSYVVDEFVCTQ